MDHQTAGLCASEEVSFAGRAQEIQHGQSETHTHTQSGDEGKELRLHMGSGTYLQWQWSVAAASQGTACFKKAPHDINQTVDRRST